MHIVAVNRVVCMYIWDLLAQAAKSALFEKWLAAGKDWSSLPNSYYMVLEVRIHCMAHTETCVN